MGVNEIWQVLVVAIFFGGGVFLNLWLGFECGPGAGLV